MNTSNGFSHGLHRVWMWTHCIDIRAEGGGEAIYMHSSIFLGPRRSEERASALKVCVMCAYKISRKIMCLLGVRVQMRLYSRSTWRRGGRLGLVFTMASLWLRHRHCPPLESTPFSADTTTSYSIVKRPPRDEILTTTKQLKLNRQFKLSLK